MAKSIPRQTGFLEREGERIYYESVGVGDPLVLCHGAGGNHAVWFQQVPVFARHRRVIVWDHRGFGRSTAARGSTAPDCAARDLGALLDDLAEDSADLVGQSMGGWTALRFALEQPKRVRRLVLANTPGGIASPELEQAWQEQIASAADSFREPALGQHPALGRTLSEDAPERAYLYQLLGGFGAPEVAEIGRHLVRAAVMESELSALICPVLFVTGDEDPIFPPALIRASAARLPASRVEEISGAGHSPYFERPDAWNRIVADFLGIGHV